MLDLIAGTLNSIKVATEIAQSLHSIGIKTAVSAQVAELTGVIARVQKDLITIQAEYSAVVRRENDLEAQIMEIKDWKEDKKRYELHELIPGTLVYCVKPGMERGEPLHNLCPTCYEKNIKSILQRGSITKDGYESHVCFTCKTELRGQKRAKALGVGVTRTFV